MSQPETHIDAIGEGLYRISTPVSPDVVPGGFTFNQYLLVDDAPLLFHTGLRGQFGSVSEAIATVLPVDRLRYIAFCHVEADECGALNEFLGAAPQAEALCSRVAAMTSIGDLADRPPRVIADGESLSLELEFHRGGIYQLHRCSRGSSQGPLERLIPRQVLPSAH